MSNIVKTVKYLYGTNSSTLAKVNSRDIPPAADNCTIHVFAPDSTLQREGKLKHAGSFVHRRHSQSCLRGGAQNAHGHHASLIRRHPTCPPTKSGQRSPHFRSLTRRFLPGGRYTRHTLHYREVSHPIPSHPFSSKF